MVQHGLETTKPSAATSDSGSNLGTVATGVAHGGGAPIPKSGYPTSHSPRVTEPGQRLCRIDEFSNTDQHA